MRFIFKNPFLSEGSVAMLVFSFSVENDQFQVQTFVFDDQVIFLTALLTFPSQDITFMGVFVLCPIWCFLLCNKEPD
jgi:hypothetical protein